MTFPKSICDREQGKFRDAADPAGLLTKVATVVEQDQTDRIPVSNSPFGLEVVRGNIDNFTFRNVFAKNPEVDRSNEEDIIGWGGTYEGFIPTAAATLDIVSTNVNDTSAGTGAQTVRVTGLDGSYLPLAETVSTDGTTPVTTTASFLRIHEVIVLSAGAVGSNIGEITATSGAFTMGIINAGENISFMAVFTVPDSSIAFFNDVFATVVPTFAASGIKEGVVTVLIRPFGGVFIPAYSAALSSRGAAITQEFDLPGPVPARADIKLRYTSHANNALITSFFSLMIEDIS